MRWQFGWFGLAILICATTKLEAQNFALPASMKTIPVEKLDFVPDASNSCMSVEGPEKVKHDDGTITTVDDKFTTCALTLFAPLLGSSVGTQDTNTTVADLAKCADPSKHMIIIGHGAPGLIATGNGTNPHARANQIVNADTKQIDALRSLKAVELTLFGCETGVGPDGQDLLNRLSQQQGIPARARNSYVVCTLDPLNGGKYSGLYVLKGTDQQWVPFQPGMNVSQPVNEASVTIEQGSCFALKDNDQQFKVIPPVDFTRKKKNKEIFFSDFRSEAAQRLGLFSEFELLPKSDGHLTKDNFLQLLADEPGIDDIDFCQVLPPGMVPDRTIIGSFTITFDGGSRTFYELRGGLAQDVEHDDVYYPMKPHTVEGLAQHIRTKWNEKLNQLKQNKLQRSSGAGKAHN